MPASRLGGVPGSRFIKPFRLQISGAAIASGGVAVGAVALLLGIAAAALGSQCPAQGLRLGICPESGNVLAARSAAAPAPPPASLAPTAAPPAATAAVPEPPAPDASAAAPQAVAATLSAHDLIEASHELLLAQAERPLLRGGFGAAGDASDDGGPARATAATPAPLASVPKPGPTAIPDAPSPDRDLSPPLRAAFGTALPSTEPPDATQDPSVDLAGVGGPLLPPRPEPLSLPAAESADAEKMEVSAPEATVVRIGDSRVNVRAGPSTEAARLFGLDPGTEVKATEASAGWQKVEDAAGRTGWVSSDLLAAAQDAGPDIADTAATPVAATPDPAPTPLEGAEIRTVAGSGVNVRETPANAGTALFALPAGEEVTVTGSNRGWLQIVDSRGRTGWAYSNFLTPSP